MKSSDVPINFEFFLVKKIPFKNGHPPVSPINEDKQSTETAHM